MGDKAPITIDDSLFKGTFSRAKNGLVAEISVYVDDILIHPLFVDIYMLYLLSMSLYDYFCVEDRQCQTT
jgi:hypothetical protein